MLSRGLHPVTDTHPTVLVPRLYVTLMSSLILHKEHTVLTKCSNPRDEQTQCPREKRTANYRLKHKPKFASQKCRKLLPMTSSRHQHKTTIYKSKAENRTAKLRLTKDSARLQFKLYRGFSRPKVARKLPQRRRKRV